MFLFHYNQYNTFYSNIGLNITEVAHDYQTTIKKYVCEDLGMVNSFDTWHGAVQYGLVCINCKFAGTKNVAKQMRKICAGTARTRDKTWFAELSMLIPNIVNLVI